MVEILKMEIVEREEGRCMKKIGEEDDIGKRREKIVGEVMEKIVIDMVGKIKRIVILIKRKIEEKSIGKVDEGENGMKIGKWKKGKGKDREVDKLKMKNEKIEMIEEEG